jgi:hypothetical protein
VTRRNFRDATSPASGNKSNRALDGSGVLAAAMSPVSVMVPVAARVWTDEFPLNVSAMVPVKEPASVRTLVALMFSVKDEVKLKADSPVNVRPLMSWACVRLPVTVLPLPLLLPEGTVNDKSKLFRLVRFDRLPQPVPEHAAEDVVNVPPVSTPEVVSPRSNVPPDKFKVICTGAAQSATVVNTPSDSSLYFIF